MRMIMIEERRFDDLFKQTMSLLKMTKFEMRSNPELNKYVDSVHKKFENHVSNLQKMLKES